MKIIEEINKEKKELKQKINVLGKEKKELEIRINNVNNEHLRLVNYFKKLKKILKKNASEHKKSEEPKESEESDFEESDFEESEEFKKFYEELKKKYNNGKDTKTKYDSNGFDKDGKHKDTKIKYNSNGFDRDGINQYTKTIYDSNGFDKDGKHKDTGIFLNQKNNNWLKNKDELLKLYNEIIKNGEFSENINKKNISSYEFKKNIENILNGKVDDKKMINKIKAINKIENDLNDFKENENINKLKNYIKKLRNSIYGNDKEKIKTDQVKSFEDQKGKGYVNLPIALSKIYTNNSSKELINSIKQLINDLYNNKQITKQAYNNLIKAITCKDQIKILDDKIKANNVQYDLDRC